MNNVKMDKFITAKEIAKRYRLSYQVTNRYTDAGLLEVAFKKGNMRYYNKQVVQKRIKEIMNLSQEGYPLGLIRRKLIGI
jgi:DNA-binding transcriptional MerR regulator